MDVFSFFFNSLFRLLISSCYLPPRLLYIPLLQFTVKIIQFPQSKQTETFRVVSSKGYLYTYTHTHIQCLQRQEG